MEPITFTAIVAALSAGVVSGVGQVGKDALVDAYKGLKETLKRKFGDDSEVVEAVDKLEKKPDSEARKGVLLEEVEDARVDQDPEVRKAAQELLDSIKEQPGGEKHVQIIRGNYNARADRGGRASVKINRSNE
jgi:hypothetical protein